METTIVVGPNDEEAPIPVKDLPWFLSQGWTEKDAKADKKTSLKTTEK